MIALIYTTTPTKKEAKKLAKILFEKRLVACIHLYKIKSMYIWEENLCRDKEVLLIIKTRKSLYKKVKHCIQKHHSYETPQIYMHTIKKATTDYTQWLYGVTKEKS